MPAALEWNARIIFFGTSSTLLRSGILCDCLAQSAQGPLGGLVVPHASDHGHHFLNDLHVGVFTIALLDLESGRPLILLTSARPGEQSRAGTLEHVAGLRELCDLN